MTSRGAGAGGRHGRTGTRPDVYDAKANQMFTCHMCSNQQNQGRRRVGIRSPENPDRWDHFCHTCAESEEVLQRRGHWLSHGTLESAAVGGSAAAAAAAGRDASFRSSTGARSRSPGPAILAGRGPPSGGGGAQASTAGGVTAAAGGVVAPPPAGESMQPAPSGLLSPGLADTAGAAGGRADSFGVPPMMEDVNSGVRPEEEDENGGEQEEEEEAVEEDGASAIWKNLPLQKAMARKANAIMRYLPTISQDGSLVPSSAAAVAVPTGTGDGKGKGKGKARATLPPPASVAAAFKARFPQAPICRPAESAEMLAKAVMMHPDKAKKNAVKDTEPEAARQAAMAMFATQHVSIALYVHEVVFFDELVALKQFQVQTPSGMGVRMICPSCKTNEFVQPPGVTGNGFPGLYGSRVRVAHDVDGVVMPVSGKYRCKNPRCSLVRESARKAAGKAGTGAGDIVLDDATVLSYCEGGVAFNTMDARYMKLLPAAITSKLPFRFFKQNGTSEKLLDMVRATEGDTTALHKIIDAVNKGQEIRDMRGYIRFARKEQAIEKERRLDRRCTAWPAWKFNSGTLISTPSVIVLNTFYKAGHEEEKYHMNAELVRESNAGGEFLNMDATFRIAGRTMDDTHCLFFALGENGKIHFYAAIKSEKREEIEPLLKSQQVQLARP